MNRYGRKVILGFGLAALLACLPALGQSPAEKALLDKAHALEQSGHIDLAAQSWQQVLLSDPNNQEALAGLARWAKISGNDAESEKYIQRLREVNPNSPEIARVQSLMSRKAEDQLLQQAATLAKAGRPEQALKIFHQAFGATPPDNWAMAYYDTEAALDSTRDDAVRGLRGLMEKYPEDPQYAIDLGRTLTYNARTRAEGERTLSRYPQDPQAEAALRQALQWDVQNPAASPEIREYLREHPDQQLAKELTETEQKQSRFAVGLARTPAERDAYAELAANHLEAAQRQLTSLHDREPQNPRVMAGLGFLRMKQNNFAEATTWFEHAEENGLHSAIIDESLATSRFWGAVQKGTQALSENRTGDAEQAFRVALAMRPASPDAMAGLAGSYMKAQQPRLAIPIYQQIVKMQPKSETAWRGLFMAQALAGDHRAALLTVQHIPPAVSTGLGNDPDYLRTLAGAWAAVGQMPEAQRVYAQALNLARTNPQLKGEIELQYAALLSASGHFAEAAANYRDLLIADADNVNAWQGLVALEHEAGRDPQAITTVERMPPEAYDEALRDGGFLLMLASIYQSQNHPDVAQEFLDRAVKLYEENGQELPIPLQLQIAAVDLQRDHPEAAYRIYRSALTQHPDSLDAWTGLIAALHATGHDADALAQIQQIPPDVLRRLDSNVQYQQAAAAIYAATGHPQIALGLTARVEDHYRALRMMPPADVEIQNAWLLFNTNDDPDLYRQLMALGDRTDMTDEQRRRVQTIWASWAERRAAQAAAAGNQHRAIEILSAAARAFPNNPAVSKALAGGYLQAGQAKDAVAIYQSLNLTNATSSDYQSMIGAALAAQNMKLAESWLRQALEKFPRDPQVLASAARFEQARGDSARAAEYWKASLNAMPPVSPATELAHQLDQPDVVAQARSKPQHGSDLVSLLNPGDSDAPAVPLPGYRNPRADDTARASNEPYGPDPYTMGTAPVQLSNVKPPPAADTGSLPPASTAPVLQDETGTPLTVPAPAPVEQLTPRPSPRKSRRPHAAAPKPAAHTPEASLQSPAPPATAESSTAALSTGPVPTSAAPLPPPAEVEPNAPTTSASIAEQQPEQLGLDTSTALTQLPNAGDEAMKRAQAALAAAGQPIDPSAVATQYEPGTEQIPPQQPESSSQQAQQPFDYQRPPAVLNDSPADLAAQAQNAPVTPGATDEQLMQESLPPLRGPYQRPAVVRTPNPREEAQQQIANIEGGYSPWLGGTGFVNHRSGTAGFDSLSALQAPFEASEPLGTSARLTVVSEPTFLDAGAPTTAPILPNGATERLGTAPITAILTQQNATGIGGEVQLAMSTFAASVGYSPYGFLVANAIGRMNWRPANGPFTFSFTRDSVKDSQLSWSGLHDPGSARPGYDGNVWGGVMTTGGEAAFGKGDAGSGYYVSGGYQYINGVHVQTNHRIDGDAGAYWRMKEVPDRGTLTVGANFFGMHYAVNSFYFTYGQGGYFSPQAYFLANVPVSWTGHYGVNLHYTVVAGLGVQAFQDDSSQYFPLDSAIEIAANNPSYPAQSIVSANYNLNSEAAYHLTDHWYAGGFLNMNNTRSYNNQIVGFYVRYLIRPQVPTDLGPTGLYPWDGLRPFKAP